MTFGRPTAEPLAGEGNLLGWFLNKGGAGKSVLQRRFPISLQVKAVILVWAIGLSNVCIQESLSSGQAYVQELVKR